MRTNIDIDDELMRDAMAATGATTKKGAVEASLRKLIDVTAREDALRSLMQAQEAGRLKAAQENRLDEWSEKLKRDGNCVQELAYADEH